MVVYMITYAVLYEAKTLIHRVILQTPDCSICQKRSGHRPTHRGGLWKNSASVNQGRAAEELCWSCSGKQGSQCLSGLNS